MKDFYNSYVRLYKALGGGWLSKEEMEAGAGQLLSPHSLHDLLQCPEVCPSVVADQVDLLIVGDQLEILVVLHQPTDR